MLGFLFCDDPPQLWNVAPSTFVDDWFAVPFADEMANRVTHVRLCEARGDWEKGMTRKALYQNDASALVGGMGHFDLCAPSRRGLVKLL